MRLNLLLTVILVGLLLLIAFELLLIRGQHRASTFGPTPFPRHDVYLNFANQPVSVGYSEVLPGTKTAVVLGQLLSLYQQDGTTFAKVKLSDSKAHHVTLPIALVVKNQGNFYLTHQTTPNLLGGNFNPSRDGVGTNAKGVLQPYLSRVLTFELILKLTATSSNPQTQQKIHLYQPFIACNDQLVQALQTGTLRTLSCTPFSQKIRVYEQ